MPAARHDDDDDDDDIYLYMPSAMGKLSLFSISNFALAFYLFQVLSTAK